MAVEKERFSPAEIVTRLRQAQLALSLGASLTSILRSLQITRTTYERWQHKFGNLILNCLKPTERFFSIDEFGPFAVKQRGGRRLVAPGQKPTVPRFQESKGSLIATAALELSTNRVTHFYSSGKNTVEMIKLLDLLIEQYRGCSKLYLSWDAASWHASKRFLGRVGEVNARKYRQEHGTPAISLAPLPSRAQFLNVIESVFSGMAKAIIDTSDYQSVDEAKEAIDRYFAERNAHFRAHPQRAGGKIWREERVSNTFQEGQNCKNPRYR